jgi:palmitoyltransferase
VSDVGAFIFVCLMIPTTYMYEVTLVLPRLYYEDAYTSYLMHMSVGFFLLVNLVGNFVGLWLTDTSTRFVVLPSVIKNSRWKFCASCESVTPPRSWHCNICNICILKREHHCMFVGYCVGHRNHRYFCLFLFYMWISVIYCSYFNTSFLIPQMSGASWAQIVKFIFPMVMLVTGYVLQCYVSLAKGVLVDSNDITVCACFRRAKTLFSLVGTPKTTRENNVFAYGT